jgi:beta-galactosidase/beta-glucuronidase
VHSRPPVHIRDYFVRTSLNDNFTTAIVQVDVDLSTGVSDKDSVTATFYSPNKQVCLIKNCSAWAKVDTVALIFFGSFVWEGKC